MSDCSTQAMMPKERRTCGNCNNWHCVGVIRGYCGLDETLENGCLPLHLNDDAACGDYEDIPPTLQERHERLAQVARDLEELAHFAILHIENDLVIGPAVDRLVILRDKLRECGVSVDDVERVIQASDA